MFTVDEIKRIKHSPLLLIKQSSDMEGFHGGSDDSSDSSEEDFDMMTVTVLLLVNNNIAMANLIAKAKHSQMINDVVAPNQDYRHGGRRPKALFCHHEALHCIWRDYFGIPGDLTAPIFKDRNFEMMF